MKLALYKGIRPGYLGVLNRVGRRLDHGPYSHAELVFSNGQSASSAPREGVRIKHIGYSSVGAWDFVNLPDSLEPAARAWYDAHNGEPYDVWGNVRFLAGFIEEDEGKWFCSESIAAALGWPEPWRIGPSALSVYALHLYGLGQSDTPWTVKPYAVHPAFHYALNQEDT